MKNILCVSAIILVFSGCTTKTDTSSFQLGPEDVAAATMTQVDAETCAITVTLTKTASKRFTRSTRQNIGKKLPIIVDGKTVCEPLVREVIPGPDLTIAVGGKEDAKRIITFLMEQQLVAPGHLRLTAQDTPNVGWRKK